MPRLDRVLAARRPAGVPIGFRGIAASKIEALQCEPVCHAFGGRATLKPDLIAAFCWEVRRSCTDRNVGTVHDSILNVGAVHVGRHVAFGLKNLCHFGHVCSSVRFARKRILEQPGRARSTAAFASRRPWKSLRAEASQSSVQPSPGGGADTRQP